MTDKTKLKKLLKKYSQVFPVGLAGTQFPKLLKNRRKKLLDKLEGPCVFAAVPHEPGAENIWIMNGLRIFQEPAMIHLTGINQPKVLLYLNPKGAEKEVLFLPEKDSKKEFWDGVRFGLDSNNSQKGKELLEDVQSLTGINKVLPLHLFESFYVSQVKKLRPKLSFSFFHLYEEGDKKNAKKVTGDHNWSFSQKLMALEKKALGKNKPQHKTIAPLHFKQRLPLDNFQVKDVLKAQKITGKAFEDTLARLPNFKNENQLSRYLEYKMLYESEFGLSFPSIVASGKNATVLHYLKNDGPLQKDKLILLDFGVRYGTMHADISRTIAQNGKWNPLQKLLYNIVLAAMKFNEKNAMAGATIRQLNTKVWDFIETELERQFFKKGGRAKREYDFQPHGVSHLMGEQEHDGDPFRVYQDEPLEPNIQISNEPGIYGHFTMELGGKLYSEDIGIRIEDNLLIGEKRSLNLSRSIPKEIGDLERLIGRKT